MRPYWKGHLKLALVSCPIALHAACSSAERVGFRQINRPHHDLGPKDDGRAPIGPNLEEYDVLDDGIILVAFVPPGWNSRSAISSFQQLIVFAPSSK